MQSQNALLQSLAEITGTGSFCSVGDSPFFLPQLEVDGIGEIAFPLPKSQAIELTARAEKAPFGKGEKTIRDESVRKCWQLDATQFRLESPEWDKHLKNVVAQLRSDLGIEGKVSAHPYKLLIYGKGGHFKAHKDTEKLDAMFGTLIIALPSAHDGGTLRVRHGGEEVAVDFSNEEKRRQFQHAAFFADCEHEVEPVRSGYRCCVVYNLRLDRGDPQALNQATSEQAKHLAKPLADLKRERADKLTAVLLDHDYTEANFSLANLKGHDAARARALILAAKNTDMIAHLGLVTYHQFGELDGGGYGGHWEDEDAGDDDGEMGEIHDEDLTIGPAWRTANDRAAPLGEYDVEMEDLLSQTPLDDGEPDEKESEGYTGNAGCTMEYWYRRAAVVLWPAEHDEDIRCHYNFSGACQQLLTLAEKGGKGAKFQRLATAVANLLPEKIPYASHRNSDGPAENNPVALVLTSVAMAGKAELLETLMQTLPENAWLHCGNKTWKHLLKTFGPETFRSLIEHLITENDNVTRTALFDLLAPLSKSRGGEKLTATIAAHLAALDPMEAPALNGNANPAEIRAMLAASPHITDARHGLAAVDFLCANRSLDHVRDILGPVILEKSARKTLASPVAGKTLTFATNLLAEEIARPLTPFPDWKRTCPPVEKRRPPYGGSSYRADVTTEQAFRELHAFMADPETQRCELRYAQGIRSELEGFIRSNRLDLDTHTNEKGRPYGLVCTKNDNSHNRALQQQSDDEKLLAKLKKL